MSPFARAATLAAAALIPARAALASDLSVNGVTALDAKAGHPLVVRLEGAPGALAFLLVDSEGGPTEIFGQSLPLGFTPALTVIPLGALPAEGSVDLLTEVPWDPAYLGLEAHLLAAIQLGATASSSDFSNGASVRIVDRDVELAGGSLLSFPWFETARAFNAGRPIEVAVDTTRHPEAAGRTADVYVVAHRSRADWLADGTLVDVSGAVESASFDGASIAEHTVTVDAGTLDADAGADLGVAYDVVVDLDQDGIFGGVDLIDGFSDAEAGLYVVHDLTQPGPLAVTETLYSGGTWLGQNAFYPTAIGTLGELPLVVVSHGNGHNYQWYDHIGNHLASYGFVVMSHQNNTMPGVESASTTTLTNTDWFLGNLALVDGGVLVGHVDGSRIAWIGHSRGGEGVARAYDRIIDGTFVPANFSASDIRLISSIAPTDFLGTDSADPHGADYHLWVGGSDSDVTGCANSNIVQSFHLLDRALGKRMSISLHGVGHGDFHNGTGGAFATGPCLVGKSSTHTIVRGHVLPLVAHHLRGNVPAEDYLWRQWERFRPLGAPDGNACVVVDLSYHDPPGARVVDDFQTNEDVALGSLGGAVGGTVAALVEGRLDDPNADFTWNGEAFNGFTQGRGSDVTRGAVFEFDGSDAQLDFELPAGQRDVRAFGSVSLRVAQAPRHPLTTIALGDLGLTLALVDEDGTTSAVSVGLFGGGVEEPYQRTSCGVGAGWGAEFETVRVALEAFTHDTPELDLARLATISLRVGPSWGSAQGRLGIDDLELTAD